ncbi:MAG: hypothetical protein IPG26_07780 [Coprothermobacter sp.]|nr:hypothetical protein [Coprothermobacter sp.]
MSKYPWSQITLYSYVPCPNIRWTRLSSKAISIPLLEGPTTGIKEEELKDLKRILKVLRERGVKILYSGAIASSYQRSRVFKLCGGWTRLKNAPMA